MVGHEMTGANQGSRDFRPMEENEDEEEYSPNVRRYWEDRWTVLNELTPEEHSNPRTLRLRLECAIELQNWETVKAMAPYLAGCDPKEDRKLGARGLLALAKVEAESGKSEKAKDHITAAIEAWPKARQDVIDDSVLAAHLS
jgi:hypothetical protein